jgi:SAM-dependent methyltransferase
MDSMTVGRYNSHSDEYAGAYEQADMDALHGLLLRHLPARGRVLEIGCGSGRDAAFLIDKGFEVTAVDAAPSMLAAALHHHPKLAGCLQSAAFPLPTGDLLLQRRFDAIVAIAVIMHIPDNELLECATQWRDLLEDEAVLVISASTDRVGLTNSRDASRRLYRERSPAELLEVFTQVGFACIARHELTDALKREIQWSILIMRAQPRRTG